MGDQTVHEDSNNRTRFKYKYKLSIGSAELIHVWIENSWYIAQSVTWLATDAYVTADPEVASSILALSLSFVEIDHEIISKGILRPSTESFKKVCCQL